MQTTSKLMKGVTLAAIVIGAAACGSSANSPTRTTVQPRSGAGARAAITAAYNTLFDFSNPSLSPKVAVVQDGSALHRALANALKSPIAKTAGGARIHTVMPLTISACTREALPSPCQSVKFDIISKAGKVLLPDNGFAVYIHFRWLVAKVTICSLLSLAAGGQSPAGC